MNSQDPGAKAKDPYVVTMVDDHGAEVDFALLDMIEVDGTSYGVFVPAEEFAEGETENPGLLEDGDRPMTDNDDKGILILRAIKNERGNEFEIIEDQALFDRVLEQLEMVVASNIDFGADTHN